MRKIGICACYDTRNYGSMLQSFATQVKIEQLGYECEYIVYRKKKTVGFILKQIPRLLNRNLLYDKWMVIQKKIEMRKYPEIQEKEREREQAFVRFKQKYYRKFSVENYGYDSLRINAKQYSSVVVGSDQLWTPGGLATNFYNLMFVPDEINKVSYATSFGVSKIPKYQITRTREYLERINHLSVREIQGAQIIEEITGRKAKVVVDPTLLLTRNEWDELIPRNRILAKKYILCYFLGSNPVHREIAYQLKEKTGYTIVSTPFLDSFVFEDIEFGDNQLFDVGPDDFVNLIRNAEYILTDSFHGSVFSILNHKQFLVFDRFSSGTQSRNSRIDSLCSLLCLENRRYKKDVFKEMIEPIDYKAVDERLGALREDSLNFLKFSLS